MVSSSSITSSAAKVGSSNDLLLEILLRLPIKSLLRFKSVSKHWSSIISDPRFSRRWRPTSSPSGLFFHWSSIGYTSLPHFDFIPLHNNSSTYPNLSFFPYLHDITSMNSSNGLICCVVCSSKLEPKVSYHVINPSTRQFTTLSQPSLSNLQLEGLTMVFDPSKSFHYKLVSVRSNTNTNTDDYHLEIYSSETRSWNIASNETLATPGRNQSFHRGVHWNGAILWFQSSGESILFQTEEEKISSIPELTFKEGFWYDRDFCVGESNGHLYLVETYIYNAKALINVYEMENDFSGWVMKYNIDLFEVTKAYPLMLNRLSGGTSPYAFDVLSVVWMGHKIKKSTKVPFLVMSIPEKIIRFNLDERNLIEICDIDIQYRGYHECTKYFSGDMHHYIEGLSSTLQ